MGRHGASEGLRRFCAVLLAVAAILAVAPWAGRSGAGTLGTILSPQYDAGVDTNGDRLFNYLRIDVPLQISVAGKFTVRVILNDSLDLAPLTQSSVSSVLTEGPQQVSVLLNGPDIYNGGVDGPYYSHITLLSDYGLFLSSAVHITSAYSFTNFQPYDARIVPPDSERTIDNDSDGLVDWIDLGFTIDVATAGTYKLYSQFVDSTYTVSLFWVQTPNLQVGRTILHQLFLGYPLRLAARNGPYLVATSLYDSRGSLIDTLSAQTSAYSYTVFEGPPVVFNPPFNDTGVDTDGNGLFNYLSVALGLSVDNSGTYILRGQLYTGGGKLIQSVETRLTLTSGFAKTSLTFSGSAIYAAAVDGPYRLNVQLLDLYLRQLDSQVYWTHSYSYRSFDPKILQLAPPHQDQGADFDGDGKFDALRLLVYISVYVPGLVRVDAGILNLSSGATVATASHTTVVASGLQVVPVDFSGQDILVTGMDGPYRMWISVYDSSGKLLDQGGHRSLGYALSDFEAGLRGQVVTLKGEAAEDVDGNGYYNRLRVTVQVNVSTAGWYRLQGSLIRTGVPYADDMSIGLLGSGTSNIDLVFSGPDISAAGVNGSYYLGLSLWTPTGTQAVDSRTFLTSAYLAASFEPAVNLLLSGRVVSTYRGTPLANATVWVLDYTNHVSRQTIADAQGFYSLQTYAGTYWIVVDHPQGQAKAWRQTLLANAQANVSLALPLRLNLEDSLVWTGWDKVLVKVRYTYALDAPALRFQLDWQQGNRDGWVEPSEAYLLTEPPDRVRDIVDNGSSLGRFSVNGVKFVAAGSALWTDGTSGSVTASGVPYLQISRPFVSQTTIGTPAQAQIFADTYFDSSSQDRHIAFFVPGAYRFVSSNSTLAYVYARKIPFTVVPFVNSGGTFPSSVVSVQILLTKWDSYTIPTPSPPPGLGAVVVAGQVVLTWVAPTGNLDGWRLSNLAGYELYRGYSASGPFVRVNGQLITSQGFIDSPGIGTFVYAVSTVNTDGVEGPLSSLVAITVSG